MNQKIANYLASKEPKFIPIIKANPDLSLPLSTSYFSDIVNAIICQQLSDKAGAAIWKRFKILFSPNTITPSAVKKIPVKTLRTSGISNAKAQYIHNVAQAFVEGLVTPNQFSKMSDEAVINQLTLIKGIGRWTAEMFCIFSLGREDIFSFGDVGLFNAICKLYGRDKPFSTQRIEQITRTWSPYRSYASLLLWKSLEMK
jgi:DNA-3-methyladenine glycosylase II